MDDLEQLYQDLLIDHYRHPRNKAGLRDEDVLAEEENPLCGDQIRLTARRDGKGCAISQASASMMTEALQGKTVAEAAALIERFVQAMRGEVDFDDQLPEDLHALRGVRSFPMRIKCATLAWHAMERILRQWQ
jgi:nitrogen fixation protein NifU and related proteins